MELRIATLTAKNIRKKLPGRLEPLPGQWQRSLNGDIIYNLENPVGIWEWKARALRESVPGEATPGEIEKAIKEGRA